MLFMSNKNMDFYADVIKLFNESEYDFVICYIIENHKSLPKIFQTNIQVLTRTCPSKL